MSNDLILIDPSDNTLAFRSNDKIISIGRVDSNNFYIKDDTVSRSHAQILGVGQDWVVIDAGSTNGTFLNHVQIFPHVPNLLRAGDGLRFGDIELKVSEQGNIRSIPSLYVFKKNVFEGEFPISSTTDFSFGGLNATIPSDELNTNELIFIVRQDSATAHDGLPALILSSKHEIIKPLHNGNDVSGRVLLKDRDIVQIGSLYVLVSSRSEEELKSVVKELNAGVIEESKTNSNNPITEMPDYLKSRMGDDGWEDPLKKKRKRTATVFSMESFIEEEDADSKRSSSTLRSQAELVGVQRFSSPNLSTIDKDDKKNEKKQLILGIATVFIFLIMFIVLFDLYSEYLT